jgi:hypothetical protein
MRSPFDGIGRRSPFGVRRSGGVAGFWDAYPKSRLHDANYSASLGAADGAAVGNFNDISGNSLAPYAQVGTTVLAGTTGGGERYILNQGAGTGYMQAASNTDLRDTEGYMLIKTPLEPGPSFASSLSSTNASRVDYTNARTVQILSRQRPYGAGSDVIIATTATYTSETWILVRYALTNTAGALLQVDGGTAHTVSGNFVTSVDGSPATNFDLPYLFSLHGTSTILAGAAVLYIAPAGSLSAGNHTTLAAALSARRNTLNGV